MKTVRTLYHFLTQPNHLLSQIMFMFWSFTDDRSLPNFWSSLMIFNLGSTVCSVFWDGIIPVSCSRILTNHFLNISVCFFIYNSVWCYEYTWCSNLLVIKWETLRREFMDGRMLIPRFLSKESLSVYSDLFDKEQNL